MCELCDKFMDEEKRFSEDQPRDEKGRWVGIDRTSQVFEHTSLSFEDFGPTKFQEMKLPLKDLIATQSDLDTDTLKWMYGKDLGNKAKAQVIEVHGKYYITDGHHRLATHILKGEKVAVVRVAHQAFLNQTELDRAGGFKKVDSVTGEPHKWDKDKGKFVKRSTAFDEHGNPYEVKPDSAAAGGTTTGLAERENIIELFVDAGGGASCREKEKIKAAPQGDWKRLGIGYGPLGGQQFPEACAMELMMGPQGEVLENRYSEDQPRDPDGKFASGVGAIVDARKQLNSLLEAHDIVCDHPLRMTPTREEEATKMLLSRVPSLTNEVAKYAKDNRKTLGSAYMSVKSLIEESNSHMADAQKSWDRGDKRGAATAAEFGLMSQHQALYDMEAELFGKRDWRPFEEVRYSFYQPRDPDGKFASGGGEKTPGELGIEAVAQESLPDVLKSWQETSDFEGERAETAIREGRPEENPIVLGIRNEITGRQIYRGMFLDKTDKIINWKSGDNVQIMPSSFSTVLSVAAGFSTGEKMNLEGEPGMQSVILTVTKDGLYGPTGGIVVGSRGLSEYKDDKEVITGGKFRVIGVKDVEGVRHIKLSQDGVF